MELQEGFWKQWDIEVLNFQLVSLLNIAALSFLVALSAHFDFAKLVDIATWSITDIYLFLGPIVATAFSLLLADASSWLITYDFGTDNEMLIYSVMVGLTALVQIMGNGSSVLVLGIAALGALAFIGASTLLPFIAISNPITFGALILFLAFFVAPFLVNIFAFILSCSFVVLVLTVLFDSIYMLFTEPEVPIETVSDLYEHGLASSVVAEWEDTLQDYFGNLSDWFGQEILEEILQDFWLHLALHVFVVLPAALLLLIAKCLFLYFMYNFIGPQILYVLSYISGYLFIVAWDCGYLLLNVDGVVVSYIVFDVFLSQFEDEQVREFMIGLFRADVAFRLASNSLLDVEGLYWGIFYLVKQVERWRSGYYTDTRAEEDSLPEVGLSLGDLASVFSFGEQTEAGQEILEEVTQPVIIILMLPLVQVLTWAFQVPFYIEMKDHIS